MALTNIKGRAILQHEWVGSTGVIPRPRRNLAWNNHSDVFRRALDGYIPGEDYPVYTEVPQGLSFTCDDKIPGYYADPETMCQVWHWCVPSIGGNVMYSFVCGPGTVFNQKTRVCDWFFKVDCPNAPAFYGINEDLYKDESGNYINGKK
ncbi:unnamed protein product [Spodoptera exigua]|nr:unnamed protein product [Spodoptera exigua]